MRRSRFVAALSAASALRAIPARAQGRIDVQPSPDDLTRFGDALKAHGLARSWHPAEQMPAESPLAFAEPQGPGGPRVPLIWLNLDHRELATPRQSHPDDEVPVLAATVLAMLDLGTLGGGAWDGVARQLGALPRARHASALLPLAHTLAHDGVFLAPKVSDAEFAEDAFPFEVVRLLTVGQAEGTIAVDVPPPHVPMPTGAPLVAYVGHNDNRHPNARTIWTRRDASRRVPGFPEAYTVALILAAADAQPAGTLRRGIYDEARAVDLSAGPGAYAARRRFAEPFIARVLSLAFEAPTPAAAPK